MAETIRVPRIQISVETEAGKSSQRKVLLEGDVLRIGSHPSNDLVLDDRLVSRFHCRLTRGPRAWTIADNSSTVRSQTCSRSSTSKVVAPRRARIVGIAG